MPRASHSHTATTIFPVCVKPFPIFSHRMASRGGEECSSDASLGGGGPGCPKRRKASAGAEALWAVHCPDGAKFSVTVAEGERVAEVKRAIAALRGVPCFAFDLFIGGAADPLCGEQRLGRAGAAAKLFMLSKVVSDRLALAAIFKSTGGEGPPSGFHISHNALKSVTFWRISLCGILHIIMYGYITLKNR